MAAQQLVFASSDSGNNNNNISNISNNSINTAATGAAPIVEGQASPSTASPSTSSTLAAVSPPAQQKSRPRSYSSRSKENLLQAGVLDNPYANTSAGTANGSQIPPTQPPPSSPASSSPTHSTSFPSQPLSMSDASFTSSSSNGSSEQTSKSLVVDQTALTSDPFAEAGISDSSAGGGKQKGLSGFAGKLLSGTGMSAKRNSRSASETNSVSTTSSTSNDTVSRVNSTGGVMAASKSGLRTRSHTISGSPSDATRSTNSPKKNATDKEKALAAIVAQESFSQTSILDSFAYFCMVDNEPRIQRKVLFAINQRHSQFHHNRTTSNRVLQDYDCQEVRNGGKRVNSLSGIGGKLNSLLRNKKQRRTRSGIFHSLNLSIHDFRIQDGLSMIEILSEGTIQKKRSGDTNKALLHAMCNRLQSLSLQLMEKGFPTNPNSPIFASNEKFSFSFPSYFQLAVSLDLVEVARTMIKNKADVDVSWYQMTPLMLACLKGSLHMVKLLVEAEADPSRRILLEDFLLLGRLKTSKSAARQAIKYQDTSGCGHLLPTAEILGSIDVASGGISGRDSEKYRQFGERGPCRLSPEFIEGKSLCLFEMPVLRGDYQTASYILGLTSQSLITTSSFGLLTSDNCEWTKQLIAAGAPLSQTDSGGSTCLHLAARRGDLGMVIVILQGGMDINIKGCNGWTALHEAISMSHTDVFRYLMHKSADASIQNDAMETPFQLAEKRGFDRDTLNLFFQEKGDISIFEAMEKEMLAIENVSPSANATLKGKPSVSSDRSKFGSIFGSKSGGASGSSSSSSIGSSSSKALLSGKRSFFGRASITKSS